MKRTLAVAVLACGLATAFVPSANAARRCNPGIDTFCSTGTETCVVSVGLLHRCVV